MALSSLVSAENRALNESALRRSLKTILTYLKTSDGSGGGDSRAAIAASSFAVQVRKMAEFAYSYWLLVVDTRSLLYDAYDSHRRKKKFGRFLSKQFARAKICEDCFVFRRLK